MLVYQSQRSVIFSILVCCFLFLYIDRIDASTEVTQTLWDIDRTLGFVIKIPILMCHAKYTGYQNIMWYFRGTPFGDNVFLKNGSADLSGHYLQLSSLLNQTSEVYFDNPLKLQGYYWCKTDHPNATAAHNYLYRATEVHTYSGYLVATGDSLGDNVTEGLQEILDEKKAVYEREIKEILFGFLPNAVIYVTDVLNVGNRLEVFFFLYEWSSLHPRKPSQSDLEIDQHVWLYNVEYLRNETLVDVSLQQQLIDWMDSRGIDLNDLRIYSTLGCFRDETLESADPPYVVTWPDAAIDEIVIPEESCSSKNGLAVTRVCTGSFTNGARWGVPSGRCNVTPNNLTSALTMLYNKFGKVPKPAYIRQVQEATRNISELSVTDLHIVTNILTLISNLRELKSVEADEMFSVMDILFDAQPNELASAKNVIKFTYRMIRIIDNVLKMAARRKKELLITKDNFLIESKDTTVIQEDHVVGISILMPSARREGGNGSLVEFLYEKAPHPTRESLAYFILPPDQVIQTEEVTGYHPQLDVVFVNNRKFFPAYREIESRRIYRILPTPVFYVSISGERAWDLTVPVEIFFRNMYTDRVIEQPVCVYFDARLQEERGGWSTDGCEYGGLKDGFFNCRCHHLSMFTIMIAERTDNSLKFGLGLSIYVGCGFSILGLSMTVLCYCISKDWRSTVDQSVLFWLAFSLLLFVVLLFISGMHFFWQSGCVLLSVILHYTTLVIAGWLLVQAVVHRLRFSNKTDMEEVPHFILKSVLSVWGTPIFIMFIIWFAKDYESGNQDNCLKTVSDVSVAVVIPISIILLVTLWLNVCAVYAITCRYKTDFLMDDSTYSESVLKFRVAFAIYFFFVLTWLFGFFSLHQSSKELQTLFSISITLTSYYITLFFLFYEISFWQMCKKWRKNKVEPAEVVKYTVEKKELENHTSPKN